VLSQDLRRASRGIYDYEAYFLLWVFVESSGRFWSLMREKAVHCLGILHYGWAWNLASKMDDTGSEAKPTTLGYVFVFWISTGTNSARDFR